VTGTGDKLGERFRSSRLADSFRAAYDAQLARWPADTSAADVTGEYGITRVQACGPPGGAALVLLHGGGCTSTSWFASAGPLAAGHRIYAVDQMGDAGMSVPSGQPIRRVEDHMAWLDSVLDGLGVTSAAFCGHSYGAWLALSYALHAPSKVTRLILVDPTSCFAGLSLRYRLRAIPVLIRPGQRRVRRFLGWEIGQAAVDDASVALASLSGEFRAARIVMPRPPRADRLRALTVPTLLLLAGNGKAHDIRKVRANAERLLPQVGASVLPGASHHSLPAGSPGQLNDELRRFLAS
jgi:pimeloyl-ACP methyl ester carboxylesterase